MMESFYLFLAFQPPPLFFTSDAHPTAGPLIPRQRLTPFKIDSNRIDLDDA